MLFRSIDASSGVTLDYGLNGPARVSGILGTKATYRWVGAIIFRSGRGWADETQMFVRGGDGPGSSTFHGSLRPFIAQMQAYIGRVF